MHIIKLNKLSFFNLNVNSFRVQIQPLCKKNRYHALRVILMLFTGQMIGAIHSKTPCHPTFGKK